MTRKRLYVALAVTLLAIGGIALAQSAVQNKSAAALAGSPIADSDTTQVLALGSSSAQYTLPSPGGAYIVCSEGNSAYILCGSNPTATTSVGGYAFVVSGCLPVPVRLTGPKCAYIAPTATGVLQFIRVTNP